MSAQKGAKVRGSSPDSKFRCWVHIATKEAAATQSLQIEGWVFSTVEKIQQVRAVALGKSWSCQYGIPRPDVAAAFPLVQEAEESGFFVTLPATRGISFSLRLELKQVTGDWQKFFRDKIVIPGRRPNLFIRLRDRVKRLLGAAEYFRQRQYEGLEQGYVCWVDEPRDWRKLPRRFRLSGWCFSKAGEAIDAIRARIGDREFPGTYGVFRADVAATYGERPSTFKSGFDFALQAPRGRATLRVEARHREGLWKEVFSKEIRAPFLNFRRPEDQSLWRIGDYAEWIKRYDVLGLADRRQIKEHSRALRERPLISVLMPVYNPTADHLRAAVESVRSQLYSHWELCIVDDASTANHVQGMLSRYAKMDQRINVRFREKNGGIAAASNDALALASGEFVALLDDDDELAPGALYFVACEINEHPDAQLIYSDEDKLDVTGRRTNPHFKSDWNYQLFLAQNFVSHLGVFRTELIKQLGFREGFDGSQDYDLVLRFIEKVSPDQIRHIPRVLYHWRMSAQSAALNFHAKPHARTAAIKAVQEHLERRGIAGGVMSSGNEDFRRVRYALPGDKPTVSLIIPTRDMVEVLRPCLENIIEKTSYPDFEIVVIDNGSRDAATLSYLQEIAGKPRVRVLRQNKEFNYGRLNNFGVQNSGSTFIALLNNDLTVINPDWLEEMVSQVVQPGVGAVGARLLYPDDHIQHSGVILGGGGVAAHAHKGLPRKNHGYFSRAILVQELSAVTAACMLVKRSVYLEVGGFDEEHLKVAFNDVDFCLRLLQHGYRIIYTPYAELYHFESASRGLEDTVSKHDRFLAEIQCIKEKWQAALSADRFYNPNLSLGEELFTLAFPPRVTKPWLRR